MALKGEIDLFSFLEFEPSLKLCSVRAPVNRVQKRPRFTVVVVVVDKSCCIINLCNTQDCIVVVVNDT